MQKSFQVHDSTFADLGKLSTMTFFRVYIVSRTPKPPFCRSTMYSGSLSPLLIISAFRRLTGVSAFFSTFVFLKR